jgi:hypothetical protein
MDGSVSTLAPLFAATFATHHSFQTFTSAVLLIALEGALVFLAGVLIGNS